MSDKTNHDIAIEMTSGQRGGFMAALGEAYCLADSNNRAILEEAFEHVFDAAPNEPTCAEWKVLEAYAKSKGKDWKAELAADWLSGRDANYHKGHYLRRLRNRLGPQWLARVTL